MATYQLQPARTARIWWATVGVTVAVLLLPVLAWFFTPAATPGREQVVLGSGDWEIRTDLSCETDVLAVSGVGWNCAGVTLGTITQPATEDPDHNLRRMVRGLAYVPVPQAAVTTLGGGRVLVDAPSGIIGMSVQGRGVNDGEQIFAVASGFGDVAAVADDVFRAMTGEGLPDDLNLELRGGNERPGEADALLDYLREGELT